MKTKPEQLQLPLFEEDRLPRRPYCTDDKADGLVIRGLPRALKMRYLQYNPPHAIYWIVLDIDQPLIAEKPSKTMMRILDGEIPLPNFLVVNPENGYAHAYYGLETPVAKGDHASQKALRYAAAIEAALITALGADALYTNLIAKNPLNKHWNVVDLRAEPYTLSELHDGLELEGPTKQTMRKALVEKAHQEGIGRNVALFDHIRFYAYQWVDEYRQAASFLTWAMHLLDKVEGYNGFRVPLRANEVKHIAKSVARWTWDHYNGRMSDSDFSALQARRGARGGRISARKRAADAGDQFSARMAALSDKGVSKTKPWEDLGISRAQWYRDQKASNESNSQT
jgi:hypothetical protein